MFMKPALVTIMDIRSKPQYSNRMKVVALFLLWLIAAPQTLQARFEPTHGFDLFSAQQEVQAGQQAAAQVSKQLPLLSNSDPITRYVQQLGAKLAAHAPGEQWPYNFHVVNQKEINAFALPGGPIYVNLGTIQAAENEAELAGVMAHEISHVVQRHSTRDATKQMEAQIPLAILGGFLGRGIGGQLAALGIQFGVGSYFLHNSREHEKEADLLGTDIMYNTGYDPHAMPRFFEIIRQQYPSRSPQFLSDHPDPGNRIVYVSKEVQTLPAKHYVSDSAQFEQIKREALKLKPLTAQQIAQMDQGKVAGGAPGDLLPSANFRQFQHQGYSLSHPDNWQVFGDSASAVTIAPQAGLTDNAVAYGLIINSFQPEYAGSLDQATHELIGQLRQSNPDLREIGHDEDIRVNGVAAKSANLVGVSPVRDPNGNTIRERDWLVTLPMPNRSGNVLYLVFISPDKDFNQMHNAFENILRSLRLQ